MKRISYFWPGTATHITGVLFTVQMLTELMAPGEQRFEWALPLYGALFAASAAWTLYAVVLNAIRARSTQ